MKRKLLFYVISVFLVLTLAVSLAACGSGGDGGDGEGGGDVPAGLTLVEGGKPTFKFVTSQNASNTVKSLASATFKTVNKVLSKDAKTENERNDNASDVEIIIGSPSFRGDECAVDSHYLGPEGYAVKLVGTRVLVLYGSDAAASAALTHLEEKVFGITSKTKQLTSVILTEDKLIESKQEFTLKSATVCENKLNSYVLEFPTSLRIEAQAIQNYLYSKVGIWLPKGTATANQKAVIIREIENGGEGTTEEGFRVYVDESQNLVIETEFTNKLSDGAMAFLTATLFAEGKTEVKFGADYVYSGFDARNIYYSDFGAKGNGRTDDFEAIKKCHEYANEYGHTVNADAGATYYIGKNDVGTSAIIMTDTNWNGCKFIFDDSELIPEDSGFDVPIFKAQSDNVERKYEGASLPITSLEKGATNIGWAPGFDCLIYLTNDNVKHFIRFGPNQNDGTSQTELILVDKDGNIDPSTPLQWTYETITKISVKGVDDKPITISGGEYDLDNEIDNRALVTTRHNQAPSEYTYCFRNIQICRSNVILKNIRHEITNIGEQGAPYNAFTAVESCQNVIVEGFEFQNPPVFYTIGSAGASINMGTYEMRAGNANNVTWRNCTQSNFYEPDGSVVFNGMMGTNRCKNLTFDNMFVCSFDAHQGTYNATIKNSTVEHLNFIGEGTIRIENTTIYTDAIHTAVNLRYDYGSTWQGKLILDGVKLKYSTQNERSDIDLIRAEWNDHDFGYQTYLPEYVEINNVSLVRYDYGIDTDGKRWEEEVGVNEKALNILPSAITNELRDITPGGAYAGNNPYVGIQCVKVTNCETLELYYKDTPIFKDMQLWIDGELVRPAPSGKEFVPSY